MVELETEDITQEDCWAVITSFFEERGVVRQQLDSFDEFIQNTIQDIVDKNSEIVIESSSGCDSTIYQIQFGQIYLSKPTITEADGSTNSISPNEARLRQLTYSAPLYVDMKKRISPGTNEAKNSQLLRKSSTGYSKDQYDKMFIGKIPIMLRSSFCVLTGLDRADFHNLDECPYDQGGYFVVNGSEKVLIAQERTATNKVFVFAKTPPSPYSFIAEVKSATSRGHSLVNPVLVKMLASNTSKGISGQYIRVNLPYIKQEIPVVIVFRALGILADKDILQYICYDKNDSQMLEYMKPCIEEAFVIQEMNVALDFIGRRGHYVGVSSEKRIRHASSILQNEFLPHMGIQAYNQTRKAYFLGYMVHRLLLASLGRRELDDRDHYSNKRMDLVGPLLAMLFQTLFKKLSKDIGKYIGKCIEYNRDIRLTSAVKSNIITNGLVYSLATGNWGDQAKQLQARTGVSQVLNRYTFVSTLSHLRRCNTPIHRNGKLTKPRQLHNTQWGMICPVETPEGQACGLVKNFALMAYVSVGYPPGDIFDLLEELTMENLEEVSKEDLVDTTKAFVNGIWVGIHHDPTSLMNILRHAKHQGYISPEISIVYDYRDQELRIFTDAGRICRPLFVVEDNKLRITKGDIRSLQNGENTEGPFGWPELITNGIVEYIDTAEEDFALISMTPENMRGISNRHETDIELEKMSTSNHQLWTHCEIHPSMILGVSASTTPFPDHNQSPRNTYGAAMSKQAIGTHLTNHLLRMDTNSNTLYYPQKPLCTTRSMEYLRFHEFPTGQNTIVAILSHGGYNQEDSLIMNQSSIDRGLFRSTYYHSYMDQEKINGIITNQRFENPDPNTTIRMKPAGYNWIDDDGMVIPGTRVSNDSVIIGKTMPIPNGSEELGLRTEDHKNIDISTTIKMSDSGIVDRVMLSTGQDGVKLAKVRVRSTRIPQIGDKFASRHGQKGIIGLVYRHEDMPFSQEGIVPDIIINPHAIPSRMTIGHLVECLLSKVSALSGSEGDATPFTSVSVDAISEAIQAFGYQKRGLEIYYNGLTGRKLEAQVFVGPTYYQKLKHMVDDKIHSRARGPLQILSRQPIEGRKREGGLRFGEMERDCIISHGMALFLKERLCDVSDEYRVHICDLCGLLAIANLRKNTFECRSCRNNTRISQALIPYACKLLFQELMAMNISPRIAVA
ncbi:beta and beta-prime subunits of DNA dependent RNA-polymerase [Basidiobolus meristosporus CBS 931.73]|uniref:DNA-directed RNA polymerase subunit beta n=1 Tax=Basidiobolus meristosporus CBS 931.73 TaxID=1314790 RepID=A0A1Y1Y6Y9_9FUNG|nr:beta and beta-prime subunits of DNA dependent RNA-polymerase [Basidiobolus meristosporus CBS 931.73]|eukprot:ORX93496.1 beta and beta-prime subunits of DNA dependent RNA-polymerase [Basidiobolus meristosporus CBS 931.73]